MRQSDNIRDVAALGPDWMGFIFHPASARYVGEQFSIPVLPSSVKKVGVFVDSSVNEIIKIASRHALQFAQLHGHEPPEIAAELRSKGLTVIKAFAVDSQFDFDSTAKYASSVDFFLFDTKGRLPGGNGISFDWSLLIKYDQFVPFFLSGGIGPSQVDRILELTHPQLFGLDVNSGVEDSPGLKNLERVKEIRQKIESI